MAITSNTLNLVTAQQKHLPGEKKKQLRGRNKEEFGRWYKGVFLQRRGRSEKGEKPEGGKEVEEGLEPGGGQGGRRKDTVTG